MEDKYKNAEEFFADMPLFADAELRTLKKGYKIEWMKQIADPETDRFIFFIKNDHLGYKSNCPFYKGYWNGGSSSSVACNECSFLLPGIVLALYCENNHQACSIFSLATSKKELL